MLWFLSGCLNWGWKRPKKGGPGPPPGGGSKYRTIWLISAFKHEPPPYENALFAHFGDPRPDPPQPDPALFLPRFIIS